MKAKEKFMYLLAALVTVVFLLLVVIVFWVEVPDTNRDLANFLLGQFAAIVTMVYSYFFGSSKGSADKTENEQTLKSELAKNSVSKSTETTDTKTN